MNRPIVAAVFIIIFAGVTAFAGSISQLVCDACRFESNDLFEGPGIDGVVRAIVFCEACRNFYTVPAALSSGSKEFFGKQRKLYQCPACKSPAVAYEGPVCPLCQKSSLRKTNNGTWD